MTSSTTASNTSTAASKELPSYRDRFSFISATSYSKCSI
nr:MAG TPA: hypothetical protein [Caudoviricetes sp.]